MGIRMSGLNSGLDTDSIVQALVSSYSLTKNNLVKAQTKLSWKQDTWKAMNTKIYSLYKNQLSTLKFTTAYSAKTASVSNSAYATVTAGSNAVNGTQSLKVTELAASGYLTGGIISGEDSAKLKGASKLSDVVGMSEVVDGGAITVTAEGKSKTISLTPDMTINGFVTALKDAGVGASFDEANQRFYINSKTSGKDHDFTLTAANSAGLTAIQKLGLYTSNATDVAEYKKWAEYTDEEIIAVKDSAYNAAKKSYETVAKSYSDKYNAAAKIVTQNTKESTLEEQKANVESLKETVAGLKESLYNNYQAYATENEDGSYTYDTAAMKEAGVYDDYNTAQKVITDKEKDLTSMQKTVKTIEDNVALMNTYKDYVSFGEDGTTAKADASNQKVIDEVDTANALIRTSSDASIDAKIELAKLVMAGTSGAAVSGTAVRVVGQDAEIELNGAVYTNNTNNFSINGLSIQAKTRTGTESVSITTDTDVDGIYNKIKSFFTEYNALIKSMDTAYNATSARGYEPLTDEEKDAMSDTEIEKWEEKIKDSLLRKDQTLGSISNMMKSSMLSSFTINGEKYSLSSFGIGTLGYFSSGDNEKGVYHINGDSEDSDTSGKEDKLKAMITNDPETVISFFTQLTDKMYNELGKKMSSTSLRTMYNVYNDKQMNTEYSSYNTKISKWETKISDMEDYYYNKFTAMEKAMATLNSQQSSLSSLFGS